MASSTITLYKTNAATVAFALVSSSVDKTVWKVAGLPLSTPYQLELTRKLVPGSKNNHIGVRLARTEQNTSTSVLATAQILVDISVPKDQSILSASVVTEMLGVIASLLNDGTALAATSVNRTALGDARDV